MGRKFAGLWLVLTLLAFGATLAGCSSTEKLTAAQIVRAAPDTAAAQDTVYVEAEIEISGMPGFDSITTKMDGAVDFANNRASMTSSVMGLEMEVIQSGSVMYMRMDGLIDGWVKMDYAEMLGDAAAQQLLGNSNSNDPAATLANLRGAADSVEELGKEEIRGVRATHYRASIDATKALEELRDATDGELASELIELASTMYKNPYFMDVWIDDDNLVRRMSFTLETTGEGATAQFAGLKTTMTMDYYDYGKPVDITIPDDSEVTDWSDYMEQLLTELNP